MNKYALEEGFVLFIIGLSLYYFFSPLLSILISAFLGVQPSGIGSFLSILITIVGIAIIIEGLFFLDEKNTKYESIGIMGSMRMKKRKEEVELTEANEKWKKLHK